jgi:hypothetical protein
MPLSVIDVSSNQEENVKRWARALKGGGAKLQVFKTIYSGKRRRWLAKDISDLSEGRLSPKRVTEVGKQLVGDVLIKQVGAYPVAYEKIDEVHHRKRQVLMLATNGEKRESLATKRQPRVTVRVAPTGYRQRTGRANLITIDDVDQFLKVRRIRAAQSGTPLPEAAFKRGLQALFRDTGVFKDWGGEHNDFFTNKLQIHGKRYMAAFALKGPGVGVRCIMPGKWGKNGNQIQRLLEAPADIFMLQFEGQIHEDSVEQLKKLTELRAYQEKRTLYYGYLDRDDCARLRAAYPAEFPDRSHRNHSRKRS